MKTNRVAVAALIAAVTTPAAFAQDAVQWRVEDGGNGHWYQGVPTSSGLTLSAAVAIAESVGGYPVTVTSAAESTLVTALSNHDPLWASFLVGPLIGLFVDDADCMPGCWVTGERFDFSNWHPGNPDFLDTEHCVFLFDRNARRWQNHLCGTGFQDATPAAMIVEWSADCNGDGIVDYGQCRDGSLPDYNGNNIPDCCEQGVPCEVGSYPVQWRAEDGGNGHWYAVTRQAEQICWSAAHDSALATGGYLATITSAAEGSIIAGISLPSNTPDSEGGPWLGGFCDLGQWGEWKWVTGETFSYTNWTPGEPNGPSTNRFLHTWPDLRWNDQYECPLSQVDQAFRYIVEWSADCNGDGIIDKGQILLGELVDANANGVPDTCECDADINDDGVVNGADISVLLGYWGQSGKNVVGDITGDGIVNGADLAQLLGSWGPCP